MNDDFVDEIEFGRESDGALTKVARARKAVYSFEARKKIERLIDRAAPDLCHAHNVYHHISPSILSVDPPPRNPARDDAARSQDRLPRVLDAHARRRLRALPQRAAVPGRDEPLHEGQRSRSACS